MVLTLRVSDAISRLLSSLNIISVWRFGFFQGQKLNWEIYWDVFYQERVVTRIWIYISWKVTRKILRNLPWHSHLTRKFSHFQAKKYTYKEKSNFLYQTRADLALHNDTNSLKKYPNIQLKMFDFKLKIALNLQNFKSRNVEYLVNFEFLNIFD